MINTSESLLDRLKVDNAHEAWREFYRMYWRVILRYAQRLGLDEHQSKDVLQETMVTLMRLLPEFAYNRRIGRFRNFLLTVVHRKTLAVLRAAQRRPEDPWTDENGDERVRWSSEPPGDLEWQRACFDEALRKLREDPAISAGTRSIFEAYVLEEQPAADVAAAFGVKENAVYQIRNRMMRRLQVDFHRLLKNGGA
jgi:RNA polymerase sigma-70 factor (ECF subfamily)